MRTLARPATVEPGAFDWATDASNAAVAAGPLDPGTYILDDINAAAVGDSFRTRFTVPAGWVWNGSYLSKGGVDPPAGAAIFFFEGPVEVYADPCHWADAQPAPSPP